MRRVHLLSNQISIHCWLAGFSMHSAWKFHPVIEKESDKRMD